MKIYLNIEDESEFEKKYEINIKDCTQTKNGTIVRIYATDAGGNYPIHGATFNTELNCWTEMSWTIDGRYRMNFSSGMDLDLINWERKIPWKHLKSEIKWVTKDRSGQWIGHKKEPCKDGQDGIWCSIECYNLNGVKMPEGPSDWMKAIARRPE